MARADAGGVGVKADDKTVVETVVETVLEGVLEKKPGQGIIRRYQSRWFELNGKTMRYRAT
jgi:hypothetical protein